ncbi:MAG: hypothetical protein J5787_05990 [Alphaproteobacteria bacterium]|nr:hypothetical protein [Alphaproteobacteria bacterium]
MTDETRDIITATVNETVERLKAAGMLRQIDRNAREKTEELLRQYPLFKMIKGKRRTTELVAAIENALAKISEDQYAEIIRRHYFDRQGLEKIALDLNISTKTARKHKQRLVGTLSTLLFSDEMIQEIFFR